MSECVEIHDSAIGDLSRDLATIHQICASHLNDLRKLSDTDTQVTTPLLYIIQGCGNTVPDLSDLVPFHSEQV